MMTLAEKLLAAHCDKDTLTPGDFIYADVDIALGNDITAPIAIKELKKAGIEKVWDKSRVCLVPDHFTPNKDIASAEQCNMLRQFAHSQEIDHYWEVGRVGVEHALLPEQGVVAPGDLVIGADSHTCTYGALGAFATGVGSTDLAAVMATGKVWLKVPESMKFTFEGTLPEWVMGKDLVLRVIGDIGVDGALYRAMEFAGPVIRSLDMDNRLSMSNMAIEAGGKAGLIEPDEVTRAYCTGRTEREPRYYTSDEGATYADSRTYDVTDMQPVVACPNLPENTKDVSELKDIKVDQVVIGSCTNGRLVDLEVAARILKNNKVAPGVRCLVIPATQHIYREASKAGWLDIFVDAEAAVSAPTCGPCLGGHMGILAAGEVALATTNRNFVGRMGHPESFVYLSNPAVAAASAITGRITHPAEVL